MARLTLTLTLTTAFAICLSAPALNADLSTDTANSRATEQGLRALATATEFRPANEPAKLASLNWSNSTWQPAAYMLPSTQNTPPRLISAIQKERALGLYRYQLDHRTAVLGWQVAPRWFLGQQRGDDSGLTLVWQKDGNDQLSLSKDGVRISRRF